ncbi:hypothetical protein TUM15790_18570 [Neisseria gonorrhoeae]|nr:hypothetical protein TUM15790_18570 [Neisseria gonorrhoeae]
MKNRKERVEDHQPDSETPAATEASTSPWGRKTSGRQGRL